MCHHEGMSYKWANAQLKGQYSGCINHHRIRALCPDMSPTTLASVADLNPWIYGAALKHRHCCLSLLSSSQIAWQFSYEAKNSAFWGVLTRCSCYVSHWQQMKITAACQTGHMYLQAQTSTWGNTSFSHHTSQIQSAVVRWEGAHSSGGCLGLRIHQLLPSRSWPCHTSPTVLPSCSWLLPSCSWLLPVATAQSHPCNKSGPGVHAWALAGTFESYDYA